MTFPKPPFADKVVHVTLSGTMLSSNEIWQTGFYMGKPAGAADVPDQAFADGVRDLWQAFFTNGQNGVSQFYTFNQVKAARLDTAGLYDGSGVVTSFPTGSVVGGSGGVALPPQCALVATLIGGSGKGLGGKGRMFLPGINFSIDNTGHMGDLETQKITDNLAVFFNGIYSLTDRPGVPVNASRGQAKFAGLGARNVPINGIRVGNVYDTHRSRRDHLVETYKVSGLVGP